MVENKFGFWITVEDEASARYAVRMAGLPVLIIGVLFVIGGLGSLDSMRGADPLTTWLTLGFGGAVILMAFGLRQGYAALVPIATAISGALIALRLATAPAYAIILPALILLLVVSGFRGWLWLRRNKA